MCQLAKRLFFICSPNDADVKNAPCHKIQIYNIFRKILENVVSLGEWDDSSP